MPVKKSKQKKTVSENKSKPSKKRPKKKPLAKTSFQNPIRPIDAAFDKGQLPIISCVNQSTLLSDVDFKKMIPALQKYVDMHLRPVWGVGCVLNIEQVVVKDTWGFVFMDDSDIANALGYHELTAEGFPLSKTFVRTCLKNKEAVSVTASHELCEMLMDAGVQMCACAPNGVIYAYEIADAPERFSFLVDGIPMSDFVYPSWFEGFRKPRSTRFDHMGLIDRPYKILRGGYMSIFKQGRWSQIFARKIDAKKFDVADHPRAGYRAHFQEPVESAGGNPLTPSSPVPVKSKKVKK